MPIYELNLKNIGPFDEINFEFDPQINVFVGPNNSGKSTVEMALGDIAVYPFGLPEKLIRRGGSSFRVCKGSTLRKKKFYEGRFPISDRTWPKNKFDLWKKGLRESGYSCFIPALRWSTDYRAKGAIIERNKREVKGILGPSGEVYYTQPALFKMESESKDLSKRAGLFETSATLVRDEELIQRIVDLDYKGYRENNPDVREVLGEIGEIASEITNGFSIRFVGVGEDKRGLYPEFETPDGKLPINVLSQGTQSIIQWLGLLLIGYAEYYNFPKNLENKPGIVIIDEIDAHMHPSWQRRILPAISRHFPKLQIFCSSHSPLVLAGLKAGQAHLLKRDKKGKVVVSRNEADIIGWLADEILRNFLDITNPTDLQTDESIERLQELRRKRKLTPKQKKELESLRVRINQQLQTGPVASEVQRFAELIQKGPPGIPLPQARQKLKKATNVESRKASVKGKGK